MCRVNIHIALQGRWTNLSTLVKCMQKMEAEGNKKYDQLSQCGLSGLHIRRNLNDLEDRLRPPKCGAEGRLRDYILVQALTGVRSPDS